MARRDELAKLLYVTDNGNQAEEEAALDWELLFGRDYEPYTYILADAALKWFDSNK